MSSAPPPPPPSGPSGPSEPPPGTPPYGSMPEARGWDLGQCLSYAWQKFQANIAQILLAALALVGAIVVIGIVGNVVVGAMTDFGTPFLLSMFLNLLVTLAVIFVAHVIGAGLIRGSLGITEGRDFEVSEVFSTDRIGPIVVTSVLVSAATFVGLMLCYLPGIVVAFVTSYSLYFVIDRGLAPVEAIKASVELVKNNLADTVVWYIVGGLIAAAGALVCLVGMLVSLPVVLIGTAYTYKKLTGAPVV